MKLAQDLLKRDGDERVVTLLKLKRRSRAVPKLKKRK